MTLIPPYLTLFPDEQIPSPFAWATGAYQPTYRQLCDRKQVTLSSGANAAADFWLFTEVPIAAHGLGFILDDTTAEFNPNSPQFGEKYAPPFVPITIRGFTGRIIGKTLSDQYGPYIFLAPSTSTTNVPAPSGMAPNMLTSCMNDPGATRTTPISIGTSSTAPSATPSSTCRGSPRTSTRRSCRSRPSPARISSRSTASTPTACRGSTASAWPRTPWAVARTSRPWIRRALHPCRRRDRRRSPSPRWDELQKFVATTDHGYLGYAVIVNKKFWDGLPPDIRTTLEGAMKDATKYANDIAKQENIDALEAVKKSGKSQNLTLTPDEGLAMKKATVRVHKEFEDKIGKDLLQSIYKETGFDPNKL